MATQTLPLTAPTKPASATLIPRIETDPRIVAFVQTTAGKFALVAFAAALFYLRGVRDPVAHLLLAGIILLPQYKFPMMAIGGIYWIPSVVQGTFGWQFKIMGTAVALAIGFLLVSCVSRWPKSFVGKYPRLALLGILAVSVAAAVGTSQQVAWAIVAALSACLWILSFAVTDGNGGPIWQNAAMFFSLFCVPLASSTPFLKRPSAMRRSAAKTPAQLAVVQLKGIKLLGWSFLLSILWATLDTGWTALKIPSLEEAIQASTAHHSPAWQLCWASLLVGFLDSVLRNAIWGNTIVAGCRLAGFHLLRNTYRPFEARTIVDFWNRYYYYFKELIADFFFFPIYLRFFKRRPRVRILFATWVSVGLGVPLFHFVRDIHVVRELGLRQAVLGFHVYLCYATMLSVGIGISQIRKLNAPRKAAPAGLAARVLPFAGVVLFFCFLHVFDDLRRTVPIQEHLLFLTRLVGWAG
jgi:hypothetical protein